MSTRLPSVKVVGALGLCLAALVVGCAPLELSKESVPTLWKPKPQTPESMVDFWGEYLHHAEGTPSVRGFGGRLMFYGLKASAPIVVDGTVTIYAYDDSKGPRVDDQPDKKFVFTREELAKHYSKSSLGHSYSFWLPWDEAGGEKKRITLITRFDDASGKVILGKPTKQNLFGSESAAALAAKRAREKAGEASTSEEPRVARTVDPDVQPASYESSSAAPGKAAAAASEVRTTTITLPPHLARRFGPEGDLATAVPMATTAVPAPADLPAKDAAGKASSEEPATSSRRAPAGSALESAVAAPPAARSAPGRFPARRERAALPAPGHVRTQPYPATWPSALPRTQHMAPSTESTETPPDASADRN